jgi:hypothetical protein
LCRNCNLAVGNVKDDISIAESLVAYLKKWKTPNVHPSRTTENAIAAGV